jgi:hypothetical protein
MVSEEAATKKKHMGPLFDARHLAWCCVFVDVLHPITRRGVQL